ncbi:MAG: phosphoribosyl-ATP diphosphatase [Tepidiphilus sp.]|jgi:phosphoribosyl-ATP pyrophosphohydrolase|nr:phosphoribosyl-ATP diphosphatase [Tepidiphilus sp.]
MIDLEVLRRVSQTLAERKAADPDQSYVSSLYQKGTEAILKKVAEEAAEVIMAAKDGDRLHLVWEVTDLWFHTMVLLAHFGLSVEDIAAEFRRREGVSGIDEKRARLATAAEAESVVITKGGKE